MTRLPRVTSRELIGVLIKKGFSKHHQVGSHAAYRSEDGKKRVIVAIHPGQIIPPKTLKAILKDAGMTIEEFDAIV